MLYRFLSVLVLFKVLRVLEQSAATGQILNLPCKNIVSKNVASSPSIIVYVYMTWSLLHKQIVKNEVTVCMLFGFSKEKFSKTKRCTPLIQNEIINTN